ncbi:MAG: hypothetical protein K2G14_05380, partial [Ruminococcus sp.]|nr:hypothetical protein [Ruminococcus sp.]
EEIISDIPEESISGITAEENTTANDIIAAIAENPPSAENSESITTKADADEIIAAIMEQSQGGTP